MTRSEENEGATVSASGRRHPAPPPSTSAVLGQQGPSVLDLIRGQDVQRADEIARGSPSATSASHPQGARLGRRERRAQRQPGRDELYVSACFADEGPTLRRFRPRARGRATRIRKRTCHITVIVARMSDEELDGSGAAQDGSTAGRAAVAVAVPPPPRRAAVAQSRQAARVEPRGVDEHGDEVRRGRGERRRAPSAGSCAASRTARCADEAARSTSTEDSMPYHEPGHDASSTTGRAPRSSRDGSRRQRPGSATQTKWQADRCRRRRRGAVDEVTTDDAESTPTTTWTPTTRRRSPTTSDDDGRGRR